MVNVVCCENSNTPKKGSHLSGYKRVYGETSVLTKVTAASTMNLQPYKRMKKSEPNVLT